MIGAPNSANTTTESGQTRPKETFTRTGRAMRRQREHGKEAQTES
jgi:hypothetical protein